MKPLSGCAAQAETSSDRGTNPFRLEIFAISSLKQKTESENK